LKVKMRLALYEPDIPQNAGALLRLGACLGVGVDIIEPCGFVFSDKGFRRAGMDYLARAEYRRHVSWTAFRTSPRDTGGRLVLLSRSGVIPYTDFAFSHNDVLILGRESAGVPDDVRAAADAAVRIPLKAGMRSLNVAQACAMVLGEALRQTKGFPY
jgi:tRNA (cytidine/uridine-2'-O-)-methyltransferase